MFELVFTLDANTNAIHIDDENHLRHQRFDVEKNQVARDLNKVIKAIIEKSRDLNQRNNIFGTKLIIWQ